MGEKGGVGKAGAITRGSGPVTLATVLLEHYSAGCDSLRSPIVRSRGMRKWWMPAVLPGNVDAMINGVGITELFVFKKKLPREAGAG